MSEATATKRPATPDWLAMTDEELIAYRDAENRWRAEHRQLSPDTPLSAAVDDGWDVLRQMVQHAAQWGVDPARIAVFGESCGALISTLAAIRAREPELQLKAQVLVNPVADVSETMLDPASVVQHAHTPTLAVPQLQLFQRLAVPPGTDPRALSPLYAERLQASQSETSARLSEYPGAGHAFLCLPAVAVAEHAEPARAEILEFLQTSVVE